MSRIASSVWMVVMLALAPGGLAQSSKPAPATRPEAAAPPADVTVKDMKVDYLRFRRHRADGTVEEVSSREPVLLITIEIANKGAKELTYKSANGIPGTKEPVAAIRSTDNKTAAVVQFEVTLERLEGVNKQAAVKPGGSVTDVLAFVQPPSGVKPVALFFPAQCIGGSGTLRISLEGK